MINTLTFLGLLLPFIFSGQILASLGQDPEVARQAGLYVLAYTPGIYLMALLDLQRRFLI